MIFFNQCSLYSLSQRESRAGVTTWILPENATIKKKEETNEKKKKNTMDHLLSNPPPSKQKRKKPKRKKSKSRDDDEDDVSTSTPRPMNNLETIGKNLLRLAQSSDDNIFQSVLPIEVQDKTDELKAKIETIADNRIVISWPEGHTLVQHFKKSNRNKITVVYVGKTENNIAK